MCLPKLFEEIFWLTTHFLPDALLNVRSQLALAGMQGTLEEWEADFLDLITFDHGTSAGGQRALAEQCKRFLGSTLACATASVDSVIRPIDMQCVDCL